MADIDQINTVEIPVTTLMKIVKHCRESGDNENMGVLMGTTTGETCFVGNCFPHHSKKSIVRQTTANAKVKKSIIDKAVDYLGSNNYDNNVFGLYINIPNGKFYSSAFIHEVMTAADNNLMNDAKICIGYERSLADMGMNPFTAFKLDQEFIDNIKGKKYDQILKDKIKVNKLEVKIFRSSYDQAFLSEYVLPNVSKYSYTVNEDISMNDIC